MDETFPHPAISRRGITVPWLDAQWEWAFRSAKQGRLRLKIAAAKIKIHAASAKLSSKAAFQGDALPARTRCAGAIHQEIRSLSAPA